MENIRRIKVFKTYYKEFYIAQTAEVNDEGQLVILFNGFQKKSQKTPPYEIKRAKLIMNEYFESKKG